MSTLKSDFDCNSSDSAYGSYSSIHDQNPLKGNSSTLNSIPNTKWSLNHHGMRTCVENQIVEEYYTYAENDNAFDPDVPFESAVDDNGILMGLDSCDCVLFERPKNICSKLCSNWIGVEKIEPWWHAVDKDDSTSLVSRMSSQHNGSMSVEKVLDGYGICFDQFEEQTKDGSAGTRGLMDCMMPESDGDFSSKDSFNASKMDSSNTHEPSGDLSRAQLLEALCHSQTRAREAEKSAQDACEEKDDIIDLFFRQASYLFAYRQWLHLLQLERLCLHLRSQKDKPLNPSFLSSAQNKGATLRRNRLRAAKTRRVKTRCCISKCAIAFAVGFGLASAGLFVGWTIGWLFPGS